MVSVLAEDVRLTHTENAGRQRRRKAVGRARESGSTLGRTDAAADGEAAATGDAAALGDADAAPGDAAGAAAGLAVAATVGCGVTTICCC